jgi:hypothetical protein
VLCPQLSVDEDSNDDSDEDDEDRPNKEAINQRLKNTFRETMSRLVENSGGAGRVMIIGKNGGLSSLMRGADQEFAMKARGKGKGGKAVITIDDEDEDEDDDSDEEGENEVKELAARTLLAVRWLHSQGRLSDAEKRGITGDIIRNVGEGEFSRAEVAYSLLIGSGLPGEPQQVTGPYSPGWGDKGKSPLIVGKNSLLGLLGGSSSTGSGSSNRGGEESFDMSLVVAEDMREFEDVCRVIARGLGNADEEGEYEDSEGEDEDDEDEEDEGKEEEEDVVDSRVKSSDRGKKD